MDEHSVLFIKKCDTRKTKQLTTGLEMHWAASEDLDNSRKATSAADCSASLR